MSREKKDKDFVHRAYYEGGSEALKKFVSENLKYPEKARNEGIQGTVKLRFEVDYKGKVHHVKVISGIGYGCDEEAIRIASLLEYKVPKTFKLKVGFQKKLNIHFRLKKEVKKPKITTTQYIYQVTSKNTESKTSYNYKINIGPQQSNK